MNIYELLRKLVKGTASVGGMTPKDAFDAMELIHKLEIGNAFGTMSGMTEGAHKFTPMLNELLPYGMGHKCKHCGKDEGNHE